MNSPIEYNQDEVFTFAGIPHTVDESWPVPAGETIHVCAWCDKDKKITDELISSGYKTSHGICKKCAIKFLNK